MARLRKKHLQQTFEFKQHGGKRKGAGRPRKGERSSEPHKKRLPDFNARCPIHITTRVVDGFCSLRRKDIYLAVREATIAVFRHDQFRIIYFSLQSNHLHLIVEAETRTALVKGMQAFLISAAKRIKRALRLRTGERRRGPVFRDRYHTRVLKTPREVRHAISYVLNNWRHHDEDRAPFARGWKIDPYSNGTSFGGWKELADSPVLYRAPPTYQWLISWYPKTWLLREGWKKHGPISVYEVPGPTPKPRLKPRVSK